ncbi:DUF5931 domain-containing protein [Streptomyces tubbatahanensis]|uniref:DUF5931 domain-containing protein n=2 Tax=Streptomyces tubbatahanensis TaxID=2923272 RepID=A0ABY3Y270_9ACTN|nr:DUF5931 domain-containing protein [Streptomyces tubbatahanensis]UNT00936.1 DUF5931 domain-containing protein [Streptomyces tubbatahanensis]
MSVEQPLWRALSGYRILAVLYAVGVFVSSYREYSAPVPGIVFLLVLACWTFATLRNVGSAERCTLPFLVTDILLGVAGILLSPVVDGHGHVGPTLPSIWVAGPVLAFALKGGWRWAAGVSVLVGAANIIERGTMTRTTFHNVLLVCVASVAIGYVIEVARASERTLARALQIEAATRERERLARDIHDGVLQVLAMVQRRGTALGGEAAELGRMAGEQEVALRALVSSGVAPRAPRPDPDAGPGPDGASPGSGEKGAPVAAGGDTAGAVTTAATASPTTAGGSAPGDTAPEDTAPDGAVRGEVAAGAAVSGAGAARGRRAWGGGRRARGAGRRRERAGSAALDDAEAASEPCDVRALLAAYAASRVTFAEPGAPVLLPARAAAELAAAVGAALDNVRRHAGGGPGRPAQAWILLEDEPDAVIVTVRDDGPGIPAGRLADAEAEGRMGVALSIRGRLRELGGVAELVSVPGQGTEVEMRVPKHDN